MKERGEGERERGEEERKRGGKRLSYIQIEKHYNNKHTLSLTTHYGSRIHSEEGNG